MKEPNLNTTKIKILTQQDSRSKIPNTKIKAHLDLKHNQSLNQDLKIITTKFKSRSKNKRIKGLLLFPQVHYLVDSKAIIAIKFKEHEMNKDERKSLNKN